MTAFSLVRTQSDAAPSGRLADVLAALGVALVALAVAGMGGFTDLLRPTDNDSLLRLVEVRDLLAGQGWFDLMQYRLGPDGGVLMHWSRLVDSPIAAMIVAGQAVGLSTPTAELAAMTIWPTLLFAASVFLIMRIARLAYGAGAVFPAAVVGGLALISIAIFLPGMIDHHNVQLMLVLASIWGLMAATHSSAAIAGAAAALSIAVGMETAPYVAIAGAISALPLLWSGAAAQRRAVGFGFGFAATAAAVFVATVPWSAWGVAACDAYSLTQVAVAIPAGIGLAAIGFMPRPGLRTVALGVLAAAIAAIVVIAFPQCLADPYASLDPTLKRLWLSGVVEAQSIVSIALNDRAILAARYATPIIALIVLGLRAYRGRMTAPEGILAAFLVGSIAVSLWQVRGSLFSVPIAAIVLAGWIARWREQTAVSPLIAVLAWVVSISAVWSALGGQTDRLLSGPAPLQTARVETCLERGDFGQLATLPPQTILTVSNLGPAILRFTGHRVLSGPYHRNVDGNLAAMRAMLASPSDAEAITRASRAGLIAFCPGNSETRLLAREAPAGLAASLSSGDVPAWLQRVAPSEGPLQLYRVVADRT